MPISAHLIKSLEKTVFAGKTDAVECLVDYGSYGAKVFFHLKKTGVALRPLFASRKDVKNSEDAIRVCIFEGYSDEMKDAYTRDLPHKKKGETDLYDDERKAKAKIQTFLARQVASVIDHCYPPLKIVVEVKEGAKKRKAETEATSGDVEMSEERQVESRSTSAAPSEAQSEADDDDEFKGMKAPVRGRAGSVASPEQVMAAKNKKLNASDISSAIKAATDKGERDYKGSFADVTEKVAVVRAEAEVIFSSLGDIDNSSLDVSVSKILFDRTKTCFSVILNSFDTDGDVDYGVSGLCDAVKKVVVV